MKKTKQINKKENVLSPDDAVRFLEDFKKVVYGRDLPTKLISLRVPENILNAFKTRAKIRNQKYQSVIVELMRKWVKDQSSE